MPDRVYLAAGSLTPDVLHSLEDEQAIRQPLKVHSTLFLALDSAHRKKALIRFLQGSVSGEELAMAGQRWDQDRARFDDRFQDLLQRRQAIMQLADRQTIPELLRYNDLAVMLLTRRIHGELMNDLIERRQNLAIANGNLQNGNR